MPPPPPPKCHPPNKAAFKTAFLTWILLKKMGPGILLQEHIFSRICHGGDFETSMGSQIHGKNHQQQKQIQGSKRTALRNNDGWLQTPSIIRVENCLGGIGLSRHDFLLEIGANLSPLVGDTSWWVGHASTLSAKKNIIQIGSSSPNYEI